MTEGNVFFHVQSDGLTLVCETFGTGETPLVAVHGLSGNRHMLRRQLQPLAEAFRITAFDQRGHCDSTPVVSHAMYDPQRMVADIAAVLDHIGAETAVIEGESMGAATALLFALKHPQRVRALLLTGPAFGDSLNPARDGLQLTADELRQHGKADYLALNTKRLREMGAPDEVIEAVQFMQGSHDVESVCTAIEAVKDWVILPDMQPLADLSMPVCIIAWPDDPLHPLELSQRMIAALPNARLTLLPSVGHVFINQGRQIGQIYHDFIKNQA